ncbi:MAG: methyltransferase domain-containing protein [Bacteroidota bacterium]
MEKYTQHIQNEVRLLTQAQVEPDFVFAFQKFCNRDHRIYSDAEVKALPETFAYNRHIEEWKLRQKSLKRFQKYLDKKEKGPLKILDLGCGNGWFSAQLAQREHVEVDGLDISMFLLEQAARVFQAPGLRFLYGDVFQDIIPADTYDLIILNDVIQYFPNLVELLNRCEHIGKEEVEIHIIDSHLYPASKIESEIEATRTYYTELRSEDIHPYLHYHQKDELEIFRTDVLYKPSSWGKLFSSKPRFKNFDRPWIRVRKW